MSALEDLLRQDEVVSELVDYLSEDDHRIARLTGPSGSGKSYAALLAGATWRDAGGRVVVATGDPVQTHRRLYPFLAGIGSLPRDWRGIAAKGSRNALRVADIVTGTGGLGGSVFDVLASVLGGRASDSLRHLSAEECEVVTGLVRGSRSRRLLVIADNAHYWDPTSLGVLLELLSPRLVDAIKPMANIRILLVDTEAGQGVVAEPEFRSVAAHTDTPWTLSLVNETQFGLVLQHLGLERPLDPELIPALHSITGGHLMLAEQLVAYLNGEAPDAARLLASGGDGVTALLEARLRSLGPSGTELAELLKRAAVIGTSFAPVEIECLARTDQTHVGSLIERARTVNFVDVHSRSSLRFSHEVLRDHFIGSTPPQELRNLRTDFERCLSVLRPADYATRAALLLEGGDLKRGRDMYALSAIAELRGGTRRDRIMQDTVAELPDDEDLHTFLARIAAAYEAIGRGDYGAPAIALQSPSADESLVMAAERNYLRALCSMEAETAQGFDEAIRILRQWRMELAHEPELAIRYLLLLQQAEVLAGEVDAARATEAAIEAQLARRRVSDASAEFLTHLQNRRSGAINAPEVAEARIADAVAYFRNAEATRPAPLELYRALTNHCGVLLKLGRDGEALATAREAERLVVEQPMFLPRPDVLAANLTLAALRTGSLTPDEAAANQRAIVSSPSGSSESFLHRCNLVSYLLLAGDDAAAEFELHSLAADVERNGISESYLIYYWRVLRISAALVLGDRETATVEHEAMTEFVHALRWPAAAYVRRRHDLLRSRLESVDTSTGRLELDVALVATNPSEVGAAWRYYARLFPCCELSFWSES